MTRPRLALLALPLALAACVSFHGADTDRTGALTLTFNAGYSRLPDVRSHVHAALRAQPDGASVFLADNGALIHGDQDAMAIVEAKRLALVCGPRAGCDGRLAFPKPPARPNPGGL